MGKKASEHAQALGAAFIAAMLMGTLCVLVREAHSCAQLSSFARFSGGFIVFGITALICRLRGVGITNFSGISFFTGVSIGLCILFYYMAFLHASAGLAAVLPILGTFLAGFWESLIEKQRPPRRDVMLLTSASIGILLVCYFSPDATAGSPQSNDNTIGVICGLLAGLFYSFYLVGNRYTPSNVGMLRRMYWQSLAGTLVLLGPLLAAPQPWITEPSGWFWLAAIGLLQGVAVLVLIAYAMSRLRSLEYGIIVCMEPTEATILGWAVYAESTMPGQWVGFAVVLATIIAKSQRHIGWRIRCFIARRSRRRIA